MIDATEPTVRLDIRFAKLFPADGRSTDLLVQTIALDESALTPNVRLSMDMICRLR